MVSSHSHRSSRHYHSHDAMRPRLLRIEPLEDRRLLAARAAEAVNAFALDVYEHLQHEEGNLFFSPLSVSTALAMATVGAGGQTAAEMEQVLHLGNEPGIDSSFNALFSSYEQQTNTIDGYEHVVANAMWPALNFVVKPEFVHAIQTDYRGHAQSVDYSNPEVAKETINSWVEDHTQGRVQDLVEDVDESTVMILTNSVYFKGLWQGQFDPLYTNPAGLFQLDESESVITPMMFTHMVAAQTELDGFQVLEMPFVGGTSSMVIMMPTDPSATNEVSTELLTGVSDWLETSRFFDTLAVTMPKFQTTVSTDLNQLLAGLGMPTAFTPGADFSGITDESIYIRKVFHKAVLEVNEQGTEAAAATEVQFAICFVLGTPVLTPKGEKPIEQLEAGDLVLARDDGNVEAAVQPQRVVEVFSGHANILELHVGGKVIRTTDGHPFFVQGRGWTPANELQSGELLSTNCQDWMKVDKIVETHKSEPVFNLRVAGSRTYFIGSEAWGFAIWAHNGCVGSFVANRPFNFMIRNSETSTIDFMGRIDDPSQLQNRVNPSVVETNADFDEDQDIDGADFLAWQRGLGGSFGQSDLATWQSQYRPDQSQFSALAATGDTAYSEPAQSTLSQSPLSPATLIDAAMTLESSTFNEESDEPVRLFEIHLSQELVSLAISSQKHSIFKEWHGDSGESTSEPEEVEANDESWLAETLDERVFS